MRNNNNKELQFIGRAVKLFHPSLLKELEPLLEKPVPVLNHYSLLPHLFKRFCELRGISESMFIEMLQSGKECDLKKLFVGVAISLYDPGVLTGIHGDVMRPRLAEELAMVLKINRVSVSQYANGIKRFLNPHNNKSAFRSFKEDVKALSDVLKKEFNQ